MQNPFVDTSLGALENAPYGPRLFPDVSHEAGGVELVLQQVREVALHQGFDLAAGLGVRLGAGGVAVLALSFSL